MRKSMVGSLYGMKTHCTTRTGYAILWSRFHHCGTQKQRDIWHVLFYNAIIIQVNYVMLNSRKNYQTKKYYYACQAVFLVPWNLPRDTPSLQQSRYFLRNVSSTTATYGARGGKKWAHCLMEMILPEITNTSAP